MPWRTRCEPATASAGTIEFYPEEGKYHLDGHRKCSVRLEPEQTRDHGGLCPKCDKPLTVGVLHRVARLADRPAGYRPARAPASTNLLRLPEIIAEIMSVGSHSKRVSAEVGRLVAALGPELDILTDVPYDEITRVGGALIGEAVARLRRGEVIREAGFDGEYGTIRLMRPDELQATGTLFDLPTPSPGNGDMTERLAPDRSAATPAANGGKSRSPVGADGQAAHGADSQPSDDADGAATRESAAGRAEMQTARRPARQAPRPARMHTARRRPERATGRAAGQAAGRPAGQAAQRPAAGARARCWTDWIHSSARPRPHPGPC